ncbi:hypothetical protein P7K49_014091 [Saguinus oedipus]|uniref:Uncharacterized protein n=1 Tax=Saguinus oedipus TaxID=9490 RepID=A0ABQ9VHT8_SAGOE|nr:hypothetical protein P7K49_014091 [Saguinus oedipus]
MIYQTTSRPAFVLWSFTKIGKVGISQVQVGIGTGELELALGSVYDPRSSAVKDSKGQKASRSLESQCQSIAKKEPRTGDLEAAAITGAVASCHGVSWLNAAG